MTIPFPKVSILISVYNQLHCLSKALTSALIQNYLNIEVVIGDDCSTDGDVEQFVRSFEDKRIKYFCNEQNLGANGNYRRMLEDYACGDYAVVLNADDYWTDAEFITKVVKLFGAEEEIVLVFGEVKVYIEGADVFLEDKINESIPSILDGNQFFIGYHKGYSLPHLACVYCRQKAIDLNFYSNDIISSDWESLLKLIQGNKLGYLPQRVGVLTRHYSNYTKSTDLETLYLADDYIHNVYGFTLKKGTFEEKDLREWRFQMLKRHHVKWLIKLWFLDKEKLPIYKNFLHSNYPLLYRSIQQDFRYQGYLLIRRFPFLLKWVFRNILKQESFILDLLAHQPQKNF